jgi:hypothetical protein
MNLMRTWRNMMIFTALIFSSLAFANMDQEILEEGYDRQSPEEIEAAARVIARDFANAVNPFALTEQEKQAILAKYQHLDPEKLVASDLLKNAVLYFDQNKASFPNQAYITIVDFKLRSDKYRFFVIDMATGAVERYHTTHGLNSDKNNNGWAESFGNVNGSGKSSLGFVRTAEVYWGKFGRSLRLDGLSTTNSNIRQRAIVYHGWEKTKEANVIQALSWGCWTIDLKLKDAILDKIKEGSLFYAGVSTIK